MASLNDVPPPDAKTATAYLPASTVDKIKGEIADDFVGNGGGTVADISYDADGGTVSLTGADGSKKVLWPQSGGGGGYPLSFDMAAGEGVLTDPATGNTFQFDFIPIKE